VVVLIYILEDEGSIRDLTLYALSGSGLEARGFERPSELWAALENELPQLLLLDIMLPGLNGLEVLRRARRTVDTPVIMLTARDSVMDKVTGLDMGAEDYITKPFEIEELLARIRAALRKGNRRQATSQVLTAGPLTLDADRYTAAWDGHPIELTHREFTLLKVLMENQGIVMSRSSLMERVWGYDYMGETNIVDVYVRYLRGKIDDVYGVKLIHTVRGVGYVLRVE
jgi:DNA-binding response OmpR family regulator